MMPTRILLPSLKHNLVVVSLVGCWLSTTTHAFHTTTTTTTSSTLYTSSNTIPIKSRFAHQLSMSSINNNNSGKKNPFEKDNKGRVLILGGSGFLGGAIAKRAILEGYTVTSLSRRGKPEPSTTSPEESSSSNDDSKIDYRKGDARDKSTIEKILNEDDYKAVIHCVGLLFDGNSGLGNLNRLVSGSGSVPDQSSSYDDITRVTAFNAIEAAEAYAKKKRIRDFPFVFTSAAEAGWPDVAGGQFVEKRLAPDWLKRYLVAKRAVEARLTNSSSSNVLRPIIFRPSLIYSLDRVASLPPVGAFFVGNKFGLPFVDRPVTVQNLSVAAVRSIGNDNVRGVQRFMQIDELSK